VRLYDRLFTEAEPDKNADWKSSLNPDSIEILSNAFVEPSLSDAEQEQGFQFERLGYFCVDRNDSIKGNPVFNRTVTLRDSWAKAKK